MRHTTAALTLVVLIALTAGTPLHAATAKKEDPKGYKLTLTIAGNKDTVMYMGNYYAGATYATDTARINKKGQFVFERKERTLLPGLYFFTNPSGNYVEFMVYHETPNFTFSTDERNWTNYMKVKGSKENELFYTFHRKNREVYNEIDSALRVMGKGEAFSAYRRQAMLRLDSIKETLIAANPNSMLSLMMNATREPSVPRVDSAGNEMSPQQRWIYYMDHYFDHMRLEDDALVRTPDMIFRRRVTTYLDTNLHNASAEIVCEYVDKLLDRAKPSRENFRYLMHTISEKYLQSNVMSYDAVYVHLVKRYMEAGDCFWMSPSSIDMNVKRANTWDRLLIGRTAPELVMRDIDGDILSMHSLPHKYTLLVFWSPTCGHCKVMIPELYNRFAKYRERFDIGAFAVLSEPDEETRPKWREFIKSHNLNWLNMDGGEANIDWHEVYDVETTPQIYLLDKDKKILAKKLNADSFELVIKTIEGVED